MFTSIEKKLKGIAMMHNITPNLVQQWNYQSFTKRNKYTTKTTSIPLLTHIYTNDRIPENKSGEINNHADQSDNGQNTNVVNKTEESTQFSGKTRDKITIT